MLFGAVAGRPFRIDFSRVEHRLVNWVRLSECYYTNLFLMYSAMPDLTCAQLQDPGRISLMTCAASQTSALLHNAPS